MDKAQVWYLLSSLTSGVLLTLATVGVVLAWPMLVWLLLYGLGILLLWQVWKRYRAIRDQYRIFREELTQLREGDLAVDFQVDPLLAPWLQNLGESLNTLTGNTERILSENREQTELQQAILTGLNEGLISTDHEGLVRSETPLAAQFLGRPGPEPYIYLRGINYRRVWDLMAESIRTGESRTAELDIGIEQERFALEVYTAPLRIAGQVGALAVLRDNTNLKQLEHMRENFVANVTHELKTPLTSIRGYIDLLRSRRRSPEEAEQFYEILEIEADRLQSLIQDLLELSEIQAGDSQRDRNQTVYLYEVADEILTELGALAEQQGVSLHLAIQPELKLRANRKRIAQLLVNLVSNAVKYNRPGGEVRVSASQERERTTITIRDNGIGIPEKHLNRIFERFYRVSTSRSQEIGGTGLGLAIVKHIAGLYGGSVQVESEVDQGSVFTVILPL